MPIFGLDSAIDAIENIPEEVNRKVKAIYIGGLTNVVSSTPVDTGLTRNSWFLSVGRKSSRRNTNNRSVSGSSSISQISRMPRFVLGKKLYFTNNRDNIETLEYGGYPDPVIRGSYIKASRSYEKLSSGGFSKQAPNGWVRRTLILIRNRIRSL